MWIDCCCMSCVPWMLVLSVDSTELSTRNALHALRVARQLTAQLHALVDGPV